MRQVEYTTYFISNYEVDMMYSIGLTGPGLGRAFAWIMPSISNVWVAELSNAEEHSVFTLYTQAASATSKRAAGKIHVSPSGSNLSINESMLPC